MRVAYGHLGSPMHAAEAEVCRYVRLLNQVESSDGLLHLSRFHFRLWAAGFEPGTAVTSSR